MKLRFSTNRYRKTSLLISGASALMLLIFLWGLWGDRAIVSTIFLLFVPTLYLMQDAFRSNFIVILDSEGMTLIHKDRVRSYSYADISCMKEGLTHLSVKLEFKDGTIFWLNQKFRYEGDVSELLGGQPRTEDVNYTSFAFIRKFIVTKIHDLKREDTIRSE